MPGKPTTHSGDKLDPDPLNRLNNYHQALKLPNHSIKTTPVQKLRVSLEFSQQAKKRIVEKNPGMSQVLQDLESGKLVLPEKKQSTKRMLGQRAMWVMETCFPELKRHFGKDNVRQDDARQDNTEHSHTKPSRSARRKGERDARRDVRNGNEESIRKRPIGEAEEDTQEGFEAHTSSQGARHTTRDALSGSNSTRGIKELASPRPSASNRDTLGVRRRSATYDEDDEEDNLPRSADSRRTTHSGRDQNSNNETAVLGPHTDRDATYTRRRSRHDSPDLRENEHDPRSRQLLLRSLDSFDDEGGQYQHQTNRYLEGQISREVPPLRIASAGEERERVRSRRQSIELWGEAEIDQLDREFDNDAGYDRYTPISSDTRLEIAAPAAQKRHRSVTPDQLPRKAARYQ
ncbi:Hypothetical predicted protein [Lecanosticta acicola]|uniref:Uncharacterized protein n=1 Tax=Lecanosticta acicola TaxID=111012 RepID=A0AAI8Z5E2_9PEZI|nr:Hypothetical predicted protein [Lecanosticta acicola]